uniref:Uncharacterized protein n=1 Tax=Anguilla anguilla TaxID=7936 RepID=A0A0E9VXB9_ANGAN
MGVDFHTFVRMANNITDTDYHFTMTTQ